MSASGPSGSHVDDPSRVLCSLGAGPHVELLDIVRPSFERYAIRHGYDLVTRTEAVGLGRPAAWGKVAMVRELLDRYDVVVWIDADAVIVDPTDDIARLRWPRPIHLVTHVVDGVPVPNSGVLVAHRSRLTIRLLERIWHDRRWIDHRWWENAALIAAVGGDGDTGLTTRASRIWARVVLGPLDHRWNSIPPCPAAEPAIVHLAGVAHGAWVAQLGALAAASLEADRARAVPH